MDWRDAAAYAALLDADRSFFAWEWLRRDPRYRAAATRSLAGREGGRCEDPGAAAFGLVAFEPPLLTVPDARPMWRAEIHPLVLAVERGTGTRAHDLFELDRWSGMATLIRCGRGENLLFSDGRRAIRLDAPTGLFSDGSVCLRYQLEGLAAAEPPVLTLRRFLALCRSGAFMRSLHPREPRARRWVLMLRASDAMAAGAGQREIAEALLSRSAVEPRWRSREPSVRSQAQRLVRSARSFAVGGYLALLANCVAPRREKRRGRASDKWGRTCRWL